MFSYLLTLSGPNFYPSKLDYLSNLKVTSSRDSGEISRIGKKFESGYICLEGDNIQDLYSIAIVIEKETTSVSEIEFSVIRYYDEQCNLEFSSDELNMLSKLNARLSISCSKNC